MDGEKVVRTVYLTGSVTFEAKSGIAIAHAAAIVNHLDKCTSSIFDHKVYLSGTGVHGIFQQFLDGSSRAINHLTSRYLVGNAIG